MKKLIKPPYYRQKLVGIVLGILVSICVISFISRDWITDVAVVGYANLTSGRHLKSVYKSEFEEISKIFDPIGVNLNVEGTIEDNENPCTSSNFNKFRGSVDCGIGRDYNLIIDVPLESRWLAGVPELERYLDNNGWSRTTYGSFGDVPSLTNSINFEFWAASEYTKSIGEKIRCHISTESKFAKKTVTVMTGCNESVDYFGGFVKGSVWE